MTDRGSDRSAGARRGPQQQEQLALEQTLRRSGVTTTALLRPALEAAMAVAREGERATPSVPAPPSLRRYLSFARLPDPALAIARKALEDDDEFRARVTARTSEAAVGRAGWLYLARPEGWSAELERLRNDVAASDQAAREERAEREAQRRLRLVEAALERATSDATAAAADAQQARAEAAEARDAAASAEVEGARLAEEVERLRAERAAAIRRLKDAEAVAAERGAQLRSLRHELRMAQAELAGGVAGGPARTAPGAGAGVAPGEGGPAPAEQEAELDRLREEVQRAASERAALVRAVEQASRAATALAAALDGAQRLLAGDALDAGEGRAVDAHGVGVGDAVAVVGAGGGAPGPRPGRARRQPAPLPPGVLDDSPEAAEHLVRVPGLLLLVDGYNISHAQWAGLPAAEQRTRLLHACAELHARCGTDIEIVFDGAGEEQAGHNLVRGEVRYRFTPRGLEADDELLARVDEEPPGRPVAVASSDRRVRDGARQRGANVLGAKQLLVAMRR